jgi:hypothetical protein
MAPRCVLQQFDITVPLPVVLQQHGIERSLRQLAPPMAA